MNKSLKIILLIMQIGGGLLGIGLIGRTLLTKRLTQTTVTIHIAFILVFLFGIIAGIALVKKAKLGLWLSAIFQAIQIPILIGPSVTYVLFSGACFNLYWQVTGFGFNLLFGSRYYFSILSGESWMAGINVLALALFILLVRKIRFEAASTKICKARPNIELPSSQFEQAQNNQTYGSPLRHILH